MTDPDTMYRWRKMTAEQREAVLAIRQRERRPWHSPPHYESTDTITYLMTAACFEHKPIIGISASRMADFEQQLCESLRTSCKSLLAWTILPNHYHAIVEAPSVKDVLAELGRLHGRTSFSWNGEEGLRGRQVWCGSAETAMKSERHFYATLNYVLHNAAHHGYVSKWTDWPFCSAIEYLRDVGRERAIEIWNMYPIDDYGKG